MYKKILLINPFGIGDVLFTTPILHAIKDKYPGAKIGYLCNRRTAGLMEENPYIDMVFVYERDEFDQIRKRSSLLWLQRIFAFIGVLKYEHFDLAIDFSLNTQYGFFCWLAGIKRRIGYDFKGRGRFLTKKQPLTGYRNKHVVEYYSALLARLGIAEKHKNLELYLKDRDVKYIGQILEKAGISEQDLIIAIVPAGGRSWGRDAALKHWAPEKFAGLADYLIENHKAKIIIVGDFSEKEISETMAKAMKQACLDLTGKTSAGELAALLEKSKIVIANDGGPLHMAVALGKKTVSFFGPVDPVVYGPYPASANHIVLKGSLKCMPCYADFRLSPCLRNKECLEMIDVNEAKDAVNRLLK